MQGFSVKILLTLLLKSLFSRCLNTIMASTEVAIRSVHVKDPPLQCAFFWEGGVEKMGVQTELCLPKCNVNDGSHPSSKSKVN